MATSVYFPAYSIGEDVYDLIGPVCRPYGAQAVIIGGRTAMEKALPLLLPAIKAAGIAVTGRLWYGGEAVYAYSEALAKDPATQAADMVFAVGGGKALDTAKVAASYAGKPVFTFPTLASNCAPSTKVCVMYHADHTLDELYHLERPPLHTFIHSGIIAASPPQYFWAGIGDALSKEVETRFASRNDSLDHSNGVGIATGGCCTWPLLTHGAAAYQACRAGRADAALEHVALLIIISTGLVSNMIHHDYNTALAHAFYYALAGLERPGKQPRLHGELVAYGTLLQLLVDGQEDNFRQAYALASSIGLPVCLADLEIEQAELPLILRRTVSAKDLEYVPYPISEEMVHQAMMELEDYHQRRIATGGEEVQP